MTLAVSWDEWRALYPAWGFSEQQAFYDDVFREHRQQQRFDHGRFGQFLDLIGREVSVVELGGWDGEFAATMLAQYQQITRWENHEVSHAAADASVCTDPRYTAVALTDFYWRSKHECDLFVASHVLEHLSLRDVLATFDATTCDHMFLQVPLGDSAQDWSGYHGSHILEVGWGELKGYLLARGFRQVAELSHPWARCFSRESA